jgi:hypothetical protein
MKNHQTKNIDSTMTIENKSFDLGNNFKIDITEIPGSTPTNDFIAEGDHLNLKEQNVFIYVINCQNCSPESESKKLKEIFDITHQKNPKSWFYIFYHQVDLQMFVDRTYDQEDFFEKDFKDHLKNHVDGNETKEVEFFRTSLYEYSANLRMSELISKYFNHNSDIVNRLLEKLNKKCSSRKVYLFDTSKKLFLFNSSKDTNEGKSLELINFR